MSVKRGVPSFTGTILKCKICEKTVYPMDDICVDGDNYHKGCFRCYHCKGTLKLGNFASMGGVSYCKPHFEQLFKVKGHYGDVFPVGSLPPSNVVAVAGSESVSAPATPKSATRGGALGKSASFGKKESRPSPVASKFTGTTDKCVGCNKTVYPLERVTVENNNYHKACFKCGHSGCALTMSNYVSVQGKLYCRPHMAQLFLVKGDFELATGDGAPTTDGASAAADPKGTEEEPAAGTPPSSDAKPPPAPQTSVPPKRDTISAVPSGPPARGKFPSFKLAVDAPSDGSSALETRKPETAVAGKASPPAEDSDPQAKAPTSAAQQGEAKAVVKKVPSFKLSLGGDTANYDPPAPSASTAIRPLSKEGSTEKPSSGDGAAAPPRRSPSFKPVDSEEPKEVGAAEAVPETKAFVQPQDTQAGAEEAEESKSEKAPEASSLPSRTSFRRRAGGSRPSFKLGDDVL